MILKWILLGSCFIGLWLLFYYASKAIAETYNSDMDDFMLTNDKPHEEE